MNEFTVNKFNRCLDSIEPFSSSAFVGSALDFYKKMGNRKFEFLTQDDHEKIPWFTNLHFSSVKLEDDKGGDALFGTADEESQEMAYVKALSELTERYSCQYTNNSNFNNSDFINYYSKIFFQCKEKEVKTFSHRDIYREYDQFCIPTSSNHLDFSACFCLDESGFTPALAPSSLFHNIKESFLDGHPFQTTTNGVASHVSFRLAVENAIIEVIERDTILCNFWTNSSPLLLKNATQASPVFKDAEKWLEERGFSLNFYLLINDTNVPTVLSIIKNKANDKYPAIVIGHASDFDFDEALIHAFKEASRQFWYLSDFGQGAGTSQRLITEFASQTDHPLYYNVHYMNPLNSSKLDHLFQGEAVDYLNLKTKKNIFTDNLFSLLKRLNELDSNILIYPYKHAIPGINVYPVRAVITGFQTIGMSDLGETITNKKRAETMLGKEVKSIEVNYI